MKHCKITRTHDATIDVEKLNVAILRNRGRWTIEIRDPALPAQQLELEGGIVEHLEKLIPETLSSLGYDLQEVKE